MRTLQFTIPTFERETVEKLVKKASKHIADISLSFGKPYKKVYFHGVMDNASGVLNHKPVPMTHEVIDFAITLPEVSGWVLKCTYEQGFPHVTDMTKPLEIKVAGHGKGYSKCDICGHKAWAKSYLIENVNTGQELQVGSECMKTFGITQLMWVDKLTRTLYEVFDFTTKECYCPDPDAEMWCFAKKDPAATRTVVVADCIRAAKQYYEDFSGRWIGGYYNGCRYIPSESKEALSNYIGAKRFSESATDEYMSSLLTYLSDVVFPTATPPSEWESGFDWQMCEALKNHYISIADCSFAFFAIKKYEQWLAMQKLQSIEAGQHVHVTGTIIGHKILEGYYGACDSYEIKASSGHTLRRNGVVKFNVDESGIKHTEFYAQVEYVCKNGVLSIGRTTKNPKKGIEYIAI